jgi:YVTN family beta-propeller protein
MKLRDFILRLAVVLLATINLPAQKPSVHEKLYISLESTDTVAVIDLAAFKQIKTLTVGSHPHGQASPQSQDKLYVPPTSEAT